MHLYALDMLVSEPNTEDPDKRETSIGVASNALLPPCAEGGWDDEEEGLATSCSMAFRL